MNIYENIIILNPTLPDEEINGAVSKIKEIVIQSGGEVLKTDMWGRKKLAYPIDKHNKGFYTMLVYKTPPETIRKLEEFYKVFDPVIKFMVVRLGQKEVAAFEKTMAVTAEAPQAAEAS